MLKLITKYLYIYIYIFKCVIDHEKLQTKLVQPQRTEFHRWGWGLGGWGDGGGVGVRLALQKRGDLSYRLQS